MTIESGESSLMASQKFLVDFDREKIDEFRAQEDFEDKKKQFYDSLRMKQHKPQATFDVHREMTHTMDAAERERLQWEREALENLDREIDDLDDLKKRYHVKQSYDVKMSKQEKEKLGEVLEEVKEDKIEIDQIKRMREEAARSRQEKLKRLKQA